MFRQFNVDLHVHTCLSPCAEDEMSPLAIVKQAKKKGLDVIGICDHNSTKNVWAVREAGWREGLVVIGGIEVCSREEVHILCLFDDEQNLQDMQLLIDQNLHGQNNPTFFGQQYLCDERDVILGQETRLLIGATVLSVEEIVAKAHQFGGLVIASHVDRGSFSIFSQLGFVPEGLQIDAMEISPGHSATEVRQNFPQTKDYPLVCFSDAHRLEEIGSASTTVTARAPHIMELHKSLLGKDGRKVMN